MPRTKRKKPSKSLDMETSPPSEKPRATQVSLMHRFWGTDLVVTNISREIARDILKMLVSVMDSPTLVIHQESNFEDAPDGIVSVVGRTPFAPVVAKNDSPKEKRKKKAAGRTRGVVKGKALSSQERRLLAENYFKIVTEAGAEGISSEDVAKKLKLSGPRALKAVFACLSREYPEDHPMRTKQFPAIQRSLKDGKVWLTYSPDGDQGQESTPSS